MPESYFHLLSPPQTNKQTGEIHHGLEHTLLAFVTVRSGNLMDVAGAYMGLEKLNLL